MPRIFVLSGPDVGANHDVSSGATFGRAAECTVPLHDNSVSRQHARLEEHDGDWHVVDTGSRNGLFVRGSRVGTAVLVDGDEFLLGEVLLRFRSSLAETTTSGRASLHVSTTAERGPSVEHVATTPRDAPVSSLPSKAASAPSSPVSSSSSNEADEIVLEGDWDEKAAAAAAARAGQRLAPAASEAPVDDRTYIQPTPSLAREQATAKLRAAGALPPPKPASARGVLQFHKVEARDGAMRADLDQFPFWLKLAIAVGSLALLVGLAWFAFRGVAMLKGKPEPVAPTESESEDAR